MPRRFPPVDPKFPHVLAERYGQHPALNLWHVSNEYYGDCHCALCQDAFRAWLRRRYHDDLDALNLAWWSTFWSHTITDWNSRTDGDREVVFVVSFCRESRSVDFGSHRYVDRITGQSLTGAVQIAPYQSLILDQSR